MAMKAAVSISIGAFCLAVAAGSWIFGIYDARRDANQALVLDASLRDSGFVSRIRYKVHLFFGADPDRDGTAYWGESALEAATRRHNQSALDALTPIVSEETFEAALSKACAAGNEVGVSLLISGRYPDNGQRISRPCAEERLDSE
jgi:hypothetical protein